MSGRRWERTQQGLHRVLKGPGNGGNVVSSCLRLANCTFHHAGTGHLHRYCEEFAFRYSNRIALGVNESQRAAKIVLGVEAKRLTQDASRP
jgi:hypothetical protein